MLWFYFSVGSIAFFSLLNLLQRVIAVDAKYPRATSIVFNICGASLAIVLFLLTGGLKNLVWPHVSIAWIFMFIATFFYALYERERFISAKHVDASTLSIVAYVSLAVAFIGSLFIYPEILTTNKIFGVLLIIVSLILVSFQQGANKKSSLKRILYSVLIFIFLGLAWMLDKKGATFFNPSTYNLLVWTIPLILIYFPYVKMNEIIHEARLGSWRIIVLAGLNVVGYYFQLKALEIGDATRVIPLVQMSTLVTVILGVLFLGEKEFIWRKIFASLIGLAGAYLLVVA